VQQGGDERQADDAMRRLRMEAREAACAAEDTDMRFSLRILALEFERRAEAAPREAEIPPQRCADLADN
jgi:hypothetical protein